MLYQQLYDCFIVSWFEQFVTVSSVHSIFFPFDTCSQLKNVYVMLFCAHTPAFVQLDEINHPIRVVCSFFSWFSVFKTILFLSLLLRYKLHSIVSFCVYCICCCSLYSIKWSFRSILCVLCVQRIIKENGGISKKKKKRKHMYMDIHCSMQHISLLHIWRHMCVFVHSNKIKLNAIGVGRNITFCRWNNQTMFGM